MYEAIHHADHARKILEDFLGFCTLQHSAPKEQAPWRRFWRGGVSQVGRSGIETGWSQALTNIAGRGLPTSLTVSGGHLPGRGTQGFQ